ncbi:hypothetical protein TorRG33x02_325450 [Trema orientale]|uniref:Uncharacterized protein n=1 Tax=Trema orientale TaxID=63057 RepID=A0A2P5BCY4_TREOI|nr:hypothetical protein TorRG33x02_325450 [Trema orientale]
MLGLNSLVSISASDPKSALALQRLVQAAVDEFVPLILTSLPQRMLMVSPLYRTQSRFAHICLVGAGPYGKHTTTLEAVTYFLIIHHHNLCQCLMGLVDFCRQEYGHQNQRK